MNIKKPSYTKGPWYLETLFSQEVDIRCNSGTFLGLNMGTGAPNPAASEDVAEFEANAKLIAASPLLAQTLAAVIVFDTARLPEYRIPESVRADAIAALQSAGFEF